MVIGIVMGIAFAACSPSVKVPEPEVAEQSRSIEGPSLELSAIDSLMWRQPDSALAQLQRFAISPAADSLDEFNGHYCQLLVSELLYKNYKPQSNRDELLQAVDYFDSIVAADEADTHKADKRGASLRERNVFLDARAHYINGAGYYDQGDVMNACAEYLKALELMEGCYEGKALIGKRAQFMANTCNRLGDLFSEQFMMESSITCYENALVYCKISPTSPTGVSNILYRIGKQYDKMNEIEKAQSYYDQALENMAVTDNMVYRNIVASKALCDYKMKEDVTHALDELNHVLIQANTENERLNRSLTIGGIFFYENNYDSALKYLEPVYENLKAGLQKQAASYLYIIYDLQGNRKQADSLMRFLTNCKKPEGENKALVSKLEDMYKGYQNQKQEKQAEASRKKAVKKIVGVIFFMVIAVALVIFFIMRVKNKKMMELQQTEVAKKMEEKDKAHKEEVERIRLETDKTMKEKEKQIEREKQTRQREKEKLQQGLQQREAQVNALEKALNLQREEMELRRAAFLKESICQKINDCIRSQNITVRNSAKHNIVFTEEDAAALKASVLRHYPNFESVLLSKDATMSGDDLQLCQLYLLGLDERQIAVLQYKSYSAIKKRANMLKALLGIEESLQTYILKSSIFQ